MKSITKDWFKVFREVQEDLDSGTKTVATEMKMAWLDEMVRQSSEELAKAERDMDDFAEQYCRIYEEDGSVFIEMEDGGEITVQNASIIENEMNISSVPEKVLLKAWELYRMDSKTQELHLMLERDEEEFYFTVRGRVIQRT